MLKKVGGCVATVPLVDWRTSQGLRRLAALSMSYVVVMTAILVATRDMLFIGLLILGVLALLGFGLLFVRVVLREALDRMGKEQGRLVRQLSQEHSRLVQEAFASLSQAVDKALTSLQEAVQEVRRQEEAAANRERLRIERLRPRVHVSLAIRSHLLLWRHYWLSAWNTGGDAREVRFGVRRSTTDRQLVFGPTDIMSNEKREWDLGDIGEYRSASTILIGVSARDADRREYGGNAAVPIAIRDWVEVSVEPKARG